MGESGRQRGFAGTLRHRLRRLGSRPLARLAVALLPPLYALYLRLVFATSRVDAGDFAERVARVCAEQGGAVALLWHEEVLGVGRAFPHLGIRPHALVALGDAGDVLARTLERCGYSVSRGGSSRHRSRRNDRAVAELVAALRQRRGVVCGLAVDGSRGPRYRMKRGGLLVARAADLPLLLVRTWYRRCLRLRSWDRLALPLPWNEIRYYLRGPYRTPADSAGPQALERFRERLEGELLDLAARSYDELGQRRPGALAR